MVVAILALSTLLLALPAYGQVISCPITDANGANLCCYEFGACDGPEGCANLVGPLVNKFLNQRIAAGCAAVASTCVFDYSSVCYKSKCFGFIGFGCSVVGECSDCTAASEVGLDYIQGVRQNNSDVQAVASAPGDATAPAIATPTPDVPTPAAPTPVPTPAAPTPSPSPPSGGGTSCIAGHQVVTIEDQGSKRITELTSGDIVLTDTGFREYIGSIHDGRVSSTLIIHTDNGKNIELTADHLIKTDRGFIHANRLYIGSLLVDSKVVRIENSSSFVVSPLTRSGTIVVNDIVLSCYANVFSHTIANFVLIPVTTNVTKDISKYFSVLTSIYNAFPKYIKHYIAASNTIVL